MGLSWAGGLGVTITIFSADDGVHGRELWRTDGTALGTVMVADLTTGPDSSNPTGFMRVGDVLYFTAGPMSSLWRTDGTAAGTYLVSGDAYVQGLKIAAGGRLFFIGSNAAHNSGLYVSDGTAAGTRFLAPIASSADTQGQLAAVGDKLFFVGTDAAHGSELWVSDGAGAHIVKDINPGSAGTSPTILTSFNGKLYFAASSSLWVSDGTEAGTTMVALPAGDALRSIGSLSILNGRLLIGGVTSSAGYSYWSLDTNGGLSQLVSNSTGTASPGVGNTSDLTSFAYTPAGSSSANIYVTDGTAAGTSRIGNFTSGRLLASLGGHFVVAGALQNQSQGLFVSDGTATGTALVALGQVGLSATLGGKLYFDFTPGVDAGAATNLWVSDGTAAGTHQISTSAARSFTPSGDRMLFPAVNSGDEELWITDGTTAGTHLLANINPPNPNGSLAVQNEAVFGDKLVFEGTTTSGLAGPWISDGTLGGTFALATTPALNVRYIGGVNVVGGRAVFAWMQDPTTGAQLWSTSGAPGDLVMLTSPTTGFPGSVANFSKNFTVYHNNLYFNFSLNTISQLYVTTGRPAASRPLVR